METVHPYNITHSYILWYRVTISYRTAFPYNITQESAISCGVAFPYKKYNIKRGGTFIFIASNLKHAHVHTYSHLQLYWTHSKQNTSYICLYLNLNGTLEISINPNISFYCNHFKEGLASIHTIQLKQPQLHLIYIVTYCNIVLHIVNKQHYQKILKQG